MKLLILLGTFLLFRTIYCQDRGYSVDLCAVKGCICDIITKAALCQNIFFEFVPELPWYLEDLRLVDNHLTALRKRSFEGSQNLRRITLIKSELGYIEPGAFENLSTLEYLDLSGNTLKHLPFEHIISDLSNLKILNLSRNHFSDFTLLQYPGKVLDVLDISENPWSYADKSTLIMTRHLNVAKIQNLEKINGSGFLMKITNECNVFDGESCRFLRISEDQWNLFEGLDLSECRSNVSPSLFPKISKLKHLNLAYNVIITNISVLKNFTQLKYLNLSGVSLKLSAWDIFPEPLESLDLSLTGIFGIMLKYIGTRNNLKFLNLAKNQLTRIVLPSFLDHLTFIDLSDNDLTYLPSVPPGEELRSLESLILADNDIETLGPESLMHYPNLKTLNLNGNGLTQIAASAFPHPYPHLENLHMVDNDLTYLPELLAPNLKVLELAKNTLTDVPEGFLDGMPNLERLDLSENAELFGQDSFIDEKFEFASLKAPKEPFVRREPKWLVKNLLKLSHLTDLKLSNVNMNRIPDSFVGDLHFLKSLDLSWNRIVNLDDLELPHCLKVLNLSNNRIERLENFTKKLTHEKCLTNLDLSFNPFVCSCELFEFKQLVIMDLIHEFHNHTKYFCLGAQNNLEYPLSLYLESLQRCNVEERRPSLKFVWYLIGFMFVSFVGALSYTLCRHYCLIRRPKICFKSWHDSVKKVRYRPLLTNSNSFDINAPVDEV